MPHRAAPFVLSGSLSSKVRWKGAWFGLLLMLTGQAGFAQCGQSAYRILFDGPGNDVAHRTIPHANGDFYVAGYSDSYGNTSDLLLIRLQPDGTLVWAKRYDVVGDDGGLSMCFATGPSGALYVGATLNGVGTNQEDGSLMKLDADGNVIWARRLLPLPYYCQVRAVAERPDGDVVVVGSVNSIGAGLADSFAARFTSNGTLVWLNSYGWSGQDHFTHIELLPDGSFTACSQSMGPGASIRKAYIAHIAADGGPIGCVLFNGGIYDSFNHGVRGPDGSYLWVGYTDSYGVGGRDVLAVLIDPLGVPVWSRTYGTGANEEGLNAVVDPLGGWRIAAFSGPQRSAHVLRVLANGDLDHVRALSDLRVSNTALWAQLLEPAADGGYYFLGSDVSAGTAGLAIEKLDACAEPSCASELVTWEMEDPTIPQLVPTLPTSASSANVVPVTVVVSDITGALSQAIEVVDCDDCSLTLSQGDVQGCVGIPVTLQPVLAADDPSLLAWQWDFGDGASSVVAGSVAHSYGEVGVYEVFLVVSDTSSLCGDSLSFMVEVGGFSSAFLGPDTVLCNGASLELSVDAAATSVQWSDGSTGYNLTVMTAGEYWVAAAVGVCLGTDTVVVSEASLPAVQLGADTVLCGPGVVELSASGFVGDMLTWSDGSVGLSLATAVPGNYVATASNACGVAQDSVAVSLVVMYDTAPGLHVCPGVLGRWELPLGSTDVIWSNGSTAASVELAEGVYDYHFVDVNGCVQEGQLVVVADTASDGTSYVPNVYTPNGDGVNDVFRVVGAERASYSLNIFNRWGELIFESDDPSEGWAGVYGGSPVPDGTYIYVVQFRDRCSSSTPKRQIGHVTLLR